MHVYIAGPLFNEGERWFNEILDEIARETGFTTYLPHRDGGVLADPADADRIFNEDLRHLDLCDMVIANLNGMSVDDGTAWELGYTYAKGKHLIGIFTDARKHYAFLHVNLVIEKSLHHLCFSLDELREYLQTYRASRQ